MHQHTCRLQKFHPTNIIPSYAVLLLSSTSAILLISPQKATHHWVSAVHRQCVTLTRGAHGHKGNYKALPDHRAKQLQYVIVCKNGLSSGSRLVENASCKSLDDHTCWELLNLRSIGSTRFYPCWPKRRKKKLTTQFFLLCRENNHWKVN